MSFAKKLTSTAIAMSLASAPVVAQAATASIEQARSGTDVEGESIRGGFLLPLAIIIAIILGVLLLSGDDDDDELPTSP